jgi:hypothetical protein
MHAAVTIFMMNEAEGSVLLHRSFDESKGRGVKLACTPVFL